MTTFGHTGTAGTAGLNLENSIWALKATPTSSGTLTTISAYIYCTSGKTVKMKAALYLNSTLAYIATSAEKSYTSPDYSYHWIDFTFSPGVSITSGTVYLLAVWSDIDAAASVYIWYGTSVTGEWMGYDSETYGTWPNPLVWTEQDPNYYLSLYGTYTESVIGIELVLKTISLSQTDVYIDTNIINTTELAMSTGVI
jgi:hypothetical protein